MKERLIRFTVWAIIIVALFPVVYIGLMTIRSLTEVGRCILFSGALLLLATIGTSALKLPTKTETRRAASLFMDCIEMHDKMEREELEGRMWQWITKNFSSRS